MDDAAEQHPLGLLDMDNDAYHSAPGYSSSQIKDVIDTSLLHWWHKYVNPEREPEDSAKHFDFGTATHTAILEPDLLDSTIIEMPPFNLRSSTARAERDKFLEENPGRIALLPTEIEAVKAIRDRVHSHPVARGLLADGKAEQSFFARDRETGEVIKCRPDWLMSSGFAMIDCKSTKNAAPEAFAKDAANMHYDISVPWYFDVLDTLYGETPEHWVWLAYEKDPPYAIGIYFAQAHDIERARECARRHFLRLVNAKRTNYWPDYAEEVLPLEMPGWVKR